MKIFTASRRLRKFHHFKPFLHCTSLHTHWSQADKTFHTKLSDRNALKSTEIKVSVAKNFIGTLDTKIPKNSKKIPKNRRIYLCSYATEKKVFSHVCSKLSKEQTGIINYFVLNRNYENYRWEVKKFDIEIIILNFGGTAFTNCALNLAKTFRKAVKYIQLSYFIHFLPQNLIWKKLPIHLPSTPAPTPQRVITRQWPFQYDFVVLFRCLASFTVILRTNSMPYDKVQKFIWNWLCKNKF